MSMPYACTAAWGLCRGHTERNFARITHMLPVSFSTLPSSLSLMCITIVGSCWETKFRIKDDAVIMYTESVLDIIVSAIKTD